MTSVLLKYSDVKMLSECIVDRTACQHCNDQKLLSLFFGYFEPVDIILLTGTLFKIVLVIIIKMISSFITVADKLLQSQVQSIEPAACCHTRQH